MVGASSGGIWILYWCITLCYSLDSVSAISLPGILTCAGIHWIDILFNGWEFARST